MYLFHFKKETVPKPLNYFLNQINHHRLEALSAFNRREVGYTLDRFPIQQRVSTETHTHTHCSLSCTLCEDLH